MSAVEISSMVGEMPEFRLTSVGHRGWIGLRVHVDPDWNEVASRLIDAYRLVAPKTVVRELDAA